MSTFVLQLPNSFVDIDCEEMEYVDGGGYVPNSTLIAYMSAFGVSAIYLTRRVGMAQIVKSVTSAINMIKTGFAATGWGVVISAYIGWKASAFVNEVAKAIDKGIGLEYWWGWTGPCVEAK